MNHKYAMYQNAQLLNIDSRCYLLINSIGFEIFKVVFSTKIRQHLKQCGVDSCKVHLPILQAAPPPPKIVKFLERICKTNRHYRAVHYCKWG